MKTALFDLDGTLLGFDIATFFPPYLEALSRHVAALLAPAELARRMEEGLAALAAPGDGRRSNAARFEERFYRGLPAALEGELRRAFDRFYREVFPSLARFSQRWPEARQVLEAALAAGWRLAVATDPVFPEAAVRERLRWAGVDDLPFSLVTTLENMHDVKPHPGYYREVLELLGARPEECWMFGNDMRQDMAAGELGIHTFFVRRLPRNLERRRPVEREGDLGEVLRFFLDGKAA
ncbi:MAG: HAD family hydrolase [Clostridia bacterium]|nr:HAD family hydrolase [Clostridia bacterium]MCL6520839.1 HAD family hydrolase [Bacillota bacterium]